jgi:putative SOS response-associated peptidase YedK
MCGRLVRDADIDWAYYGVREVRETAVRHASFNIGPTVWDLQIHTDPDGRELVASRWGLIPRWAKDRGIGSKMFNARAETLMEKRSFKTLVGKSRCIIPASGFYEWRKDGSRKTPLYIHRADGDPLTLAGLWTTWTDPESGEVVPSHTIITCSPNGMMEAIHNRMPVVLDREGIDLWLDEEVTDPAEVLPLLVPCPDEALTAYEVGAAVGNMRNDGRDLITPVSEQRQ